SVLHSYPDEEKALQCKIISLLQLNKFDDALQTFEKYSKISENLHFERAYCHYRLSNINKALEIINESNDNSFRMKELKAQVLYRLEDYEDCYRVYKDVIKNTHDEYEDERETNLAAVIANLGREKDSQNIYTSILKEKPTDVGLVAVANNNMAVINRDQNLFDSKKRMKNTLLDELEHKLNSRQKKIILMNNCLLALYTNQNVLCNQYCDKLLAKYPDSAETVALIKAVSFSKDNKMVEAGESTVAAKSLEELLKVQPDDKKTMAQLVIAYAQFDAKKALALSRKLPQLDPVTDVDVLESSNWVMGAKVIKKVGAKPDPTSPG
ncbi:hypothetical protein WDU94_013228, partial [Cyamophila willieti]